MSPVAVPAWVVPAAAGRFGEAQDTSQGLAGLQGAEEHAERLEREAESLQPKDGGETVGVLRSVQAGAPP